MTIQERIVRLLACPDCHSPLVKGNDDFLCQTCARSFKVKGGVPVLCNRESEAVQISGASAYADHDSGSRENRLKRIFPPPNFIVTRPTLHDRLRDQYILGAPPRSHDPEPGKWDCAPHIAFGFG
jgi:uncharacterized protein YbaR (Trm112 family)